MKIVDTRRQIKSPIVSTVIVHDKRMRDKYNQEVNWVPYKDDRWGTALLNSRKSKKHDTAV